MEFKRTWSLEECFIWQMEGNRHCRLFSKRGVECWIWIGGVGLSGPGNMKVTWKFSWSLHLLEEDLGVSRKNLLLDRLDSMWFYNQPVSLLCSLYSESDLELAILCCSRVRAMWLKLLFVRNLKQEAEILIEEFWNKLSGLLGSALRG